MTFLEENGFSLESINNLKENTPDKILEVISQKQKLVLHNLNYLKDLGITKYQEVFVRYPEMFLMDNSNFEEIFSKYEVPDLIEKIDKNIGIVEFL